MIKEFITKLKGVKKPINNFSVNGDRIVLLHEEGFVSVFDKNSLKKLYELNSDINARKVFHLPNFGTVVSGFSVMKVFKERTKQFVDGNYYPILDAIEDSFPIYHHGLIGAIEWEKFNGPHTREPISFIKPETLECFHRVERPRSTNSHLPTVAKDGSMFYSCSESVERFPSYGKEREPFQFADIKGDQWAMINGASLLYQNFHISYDFNDILVGIQGSLLGIEKAKGKIRITDRLETYSGEYQLPTSENISIRDYYLNGKHLVLQTDKNLIHINLHKKQASLIPIENSCKISQKPSHPYLILLKNQDECHVYNLDTQTLIKGTIGNEQYDRFIIPSYDFILRVTPKDRKNEAIVIKNNSLTTNILSDEYDSARCETLIGNGRILFFMEKNFYILHSNQLMEHVNGI